MTARENYILRCAITLATTPSAGVLGENEVLKKEVVLRLCGHRKGATPVSLVRSDLTGGAVNGGVNSRSLTDLTISQGLFMTEMNIASEKTRWFSVNSHLVCVLFTLHPYSHLRCTLAVIASSVNPTTDTGCTQDTLFIMTDTYIEPQRVT